MERKRKSFGYLTAKMYGGEDQHKTLGIRFEPKDKMEAMKLASGILKAIEYGTKIDITIFKYKRSKSGKTAITVTAPIRK